MDELPNLLHQRDQCWDNLIDPCQSFLQMTCTLPQSLQQRQEESSLLLAKLMALQDRIIELIGSSSLSSSFNQQNQQQPTSLHDIVNICIPFFDMNDSSYIEYKSSANEWRFVYQDELKHIQITLDNNIPFNQDNINIINKLEDMRQQVNF